MSEIVKIKSNVKISQISLRHNPEVTIADWDILEPVKPPFDSRKITPASKLPDPPKPRPAVIKKEQIEIPQKQLDDEYQKGFEAGIATGKAINAREYEARLSDDRQRTILKVLVQLETMMSSMQKEFTTLQSTSEEVVTRFALGIAELILRREVKLDSKIVIDQIKEALKRVLGVEHIKVRVNPADEEIVREHRAAIMSHSDSIRDMIIEADQKVELGGCILESDSGNVDARLSTQLKKIESLLIETIVHPEA